MKICLTAQERKLDSFLFPSFGRAPYFLIYDLKKEKGKFVANPAFSALKGAGVLASQTVIQEKIGAIISGNFGPTAFSLLERTGVNLYTAPLSPLETVITMFKEGKLEKVVAPLSPRFGRGFGGRGRRMRRGWGWQGK